MGKEEIERPINEFSIEGYLAFVNAVLIFYDFVMSTPCDCDVPLCYELGDAEKALLDTDIAAELKKERKKPKC